MCSLQSERFQNFNNFILLYSKYGSDKFWLFSRFNSHWKRNAVEARNKFLFLDMKMVFKQAFISSLSGNKRKFIGAKHFAFKSLLKIYDGLSLLFV